MFDEQGHTAKGSSNTKHFEFLTNSDIYLSPETKVRSQSKGPARVEFVELALRTKSSYSKCHSPTQSAENHRIFPSFFRTW